MENASKALLIAGTVLIAIILFSVGIAIISNADKVISSVEDTNSTNAAVY